MSTLKKSQRVLSGLKLIGNFVERPLKVGDIVLNDDGQHKLWANIEDVVEGFSLEGKLEVSNSANLKFTSESDVDVKFGGTANNLVAEGKVVLEFKSQNSAFISLNQIVRTSVKLGLVNSVLKKYWAEQGFDKLNKLNKYHFISEVITAQSGTVIFSQDKSNTVILKGKNNVPLPSFAAIGSGKVELDFSSKETLQIISEKTIQPLYSAVRYRKNGNFEVV